MIDHDRWFKELLTPFFGDFVEVFLPDLARYLDPASLDFLDKELFTDIPSGERRNADMVVRARFRDQEAFFLVHLEHQSSVEADLGRRLFEYFARLHEKYGLPVYPIVLFSHDGLRPQPEVYQISFPEFQVLRFQYRVIQLSRLRWRDFAQRPNPTAAALMARMGMSAAERPTVKLECLRLLTSLGLEPSRTRLISGFVDTYLPLNPQESLLFKAQADSLLNRTERNKVMEFTTSWKEEGRQEGQLELVLRQLRRRFGSVSPELESKVRALPGPALQDLAEALLDFSGVADLQRWLGERH